MSIISRFQSIEDADKTRAVRTLVENSTPDFNFFFMLTLAVLMATLGMLAGSETIVIGSMLIAPIIYPVISLSLGLSMSDRTLMRRSFMTLVKSLLLVVGASIVATFFFSFGDGVVTDSQILLLRTEPSLIFLAIAVVSGLAVTYALVRPKLSETLPGIAVSVALLPPMAVVGIGIAWLSWSIVAGATLMLLINLLGIIAATMVSFSVMDVKKERVTAHRTIRQEEERVQEEAARAEEVDEQAAKEEEAIRHSEEGSDRGPRQSG